MFDIFGYWSAVTFFSVGYIALPLAALYLVTIQVIVSGIPDTEDKEKVGCWLFYQKNWDSRASDWLLFGGKVKLPCWIPIIALILSGFFWFASLMVNSFTEVTRNIQDLSAITQPVFSYIGAMFVLLFTVRLLTSYIYKGVKFKEKVESHLSDKQAHNEATVTQHRRESCED